MTYENQAPIILIPDLREIKTRLSGFLTEGIARQSINQDQADSICQRIASHSGCAVEAHTLGSILKESCYKLGLSRKVPPDMLAETLGLRLVELEKNLPEADKEMLGKLMLDSIEGMDTVSTTIVLPRTWTAFRKILNGILKPIGAHKYIPIYKSLAQGSEEPLNSSELVELVKQSIGECLPPSVMEAITCTLSTRVSRVHIQGHALFNGVTEKEVYLLSRQQRELEMERRRQMIDNMISLFSRMRDIDEE